MVAVIELVPREQGKRGQCCRKFRFVPLRKRKREAEREVKFKGGIVMKEWTCRGHVTGRMMRGKIMTD